MPGVPGDIRYCINKVVPKPSQVRTRKQIVRLISALKRSESRKTRCGRRLIRLYEKQRAAYKSIR